MALTPEQLYRLGAELLGWNNSTTAGKALIAEDMALLQRLQLAHGSSNATYWTNQYSAIGKSSTGLSASRRVLRQCRCCDN